MEKFAGGLNRFTRIFVTVISINGGGKRLLLKEKEGFWNKIQGLWFLIVGTIVQTIRDSIFYVYYLKKQEKMLQVWKIK